MNLYNDCDPFAAEWLRSLVANNCIPEGVVDGRPFQELEISELVRYRQCHFFAGIAGWPEALRLAGLQHATGIWTQSLPCQPLSSAGQQRGEKDERHLWPEFYSLVSECRPAVLFGEQSGSKDGREWIDGVSADLEELGYIVGSSDLCVAGIGGPHIRQRIYWGAIRLEYATSERWEQRRTESGGRCVVGGCSNGGMADSEHDAGRAKHVDQPWQRTPSETDAAECSGIGRMADTQDSDGRCGISGTQAGTRKNGERWIGPAGSGPDGGMGNATSNDERRVEQRQQIDPEGIAAGGSGSGMDDAVRQGLEGHSWDGHNRNESRWIDAGQDGSTSSSDPWRDWYLIKCRDGKARRLGTTVRPLAYVVPRDLGQRKPELRSLLRPAGRNRVGRLKGYGNAIVPPLAAMFVKSFFESVEQLRSNK
jgi:DNA (cytosine-5)-methyltransferase 1